MYDSSLSVVLLLERDLELCLDPGIDFDTAQPLEFELNLEREFDFDLDLRLVMETTSDTLSSSACNSTASNFGSFEQRALAVVSSLNSCFSP